MGGGVGEVHGAKLVGLLRRALRDRPDAVVLLAESGGVRLHEANAGLIAVSEVMRARARRARRRHPGDRADRRRQRLLRRHGHRRALRRLRRDERRRRGSRCPGPEVIEASHGVEEFDSRDRALVWRTTGGKHRWLTGDCDALVEDDVRGLPRGGHRRARRASRPVTLEALEAEHALLDARLRCCRRRPTAPMRRSGCGATGHRRGRARARAGCGRGARAARRHDEGERP